MDSKKLLPIILIIAIVIVGGYFVFKKTPLPTDGAAASVGNTNKGKGGGNSGPKLNKNCVQANPTVVITAPAVTTVISGGTLTYQVTTTNNDSARCGASYFNVLPFRTATDYGWFYGTFASTTINPGQSVTVPVMITPPAGTIPGDQYFVYRATNRSYPTFWANSEPSMLTVQ